MTQFRFYVRAFGIALLATAFMVALPQLVLVPLFGFSPRFLISILAVLLAARLGNLQSGLIATALNAALLWGWFFDDASFGSLTTARQVRLFTFVFTGVVISWGSDALNTARQRAEQRQRELEEEARRRQHAEAELREQEERIRLAVEAAEVGTFDFNPMTGEQAWSSRAKVMFGLSPDADLKNISFRDRVHPDDTERVNQAIQAAFDPAGDGSYQTECRLVLPDGTLRWFIAKGQASFEGEGPNRHAARFIGIVVDITERKRVEETLREAEERFRALATFAPVGIFQTDAAGAGVFANEAWSAITGATPEQALGNGWARFVHPEDRQLVFQGWQDATRNLQNEITEFRFVNPETGVRWVVASTAAILGHAGQVTGFVGTVVDLTERKAVEDVIREDEARLRSILDNTPAVISLKDLQGRYVLVNRGWEELFGIEQNQIAGLTNEELLSQTNSPHMSREIADQFLRIDRAVIETGGPVEFEDPVQYGDVPQFFFTVKFPIKDASGKISGVGGISIDITERRQALDALAAEQDLLRHTIEVQDHERQIIAYDIHDGLIQYATGALMQLEAMRPSLNSTPATDQLDGVIGILRRAVAEGRRLMSGIRTPVLDGLGAVAAIGNLIEEEERAHVQVEFIHEDDIGRMDPKIEEAIYRISQEAMTNIEKHSQSKKVRVELKRRGEVVCLEVRDWGVGFTHSKRVGGSVHGLRGMVERARIAGGHCTIQSAPGAGTRIIAELPYVGRV